MSTCMYCNAPLQEGAAFCSTCGKKQVTVYRQTFRRENLREDAFIQKINDWFAAYPQVANVKGTFLLKHKTGLMVNKYVLDALSIEYEMFKGGNQNQYAVVHLAEHGITRTETNVLLARWKQNNPYATVVKTDGGINQRGTTGSLALGGFGAMNHSQLYVLFKFDRTNGTALPPRT